ncbi:MAG: efflux RND transporter periplasmic adaptor subunit [Candidatus Margulisbacteria bacterium]|nr:efflux RND transporter periplasmic adaptor subunit [Candidatus Margulisiibacteriota bacterium]
MKFIPVYLLILMCVFLSGCSKFVSKRESHSSVKAPSKQVKVLKLKSVSFQAERKLSAETMPIEDLILSTQVGGKVEWLVGDIGKPIFKGGVLAKVDATRGRALMEAADIGVSSAKSELDAVSELYENKLASKSEFDLARIQYATASAEHVVANTAYESAIIRSPLNGFIAKKFVEKFEVLAPRAPVFNVIDISKLKINLALSQEDLIHVKQNEAVTVYIDALKASFSGVVDAIGPKADRGTKSFPVKIVMDNPHQLIKAGMLAVVRIPTRYYENAIVVRHDYIVERKGQKYVYLLKDNQALEATVVLGEVHKDHVRIESGLSEGDLLIVEGQHLLQNKEPVAH